MLQLPTQTMAQIQPCLCTIQANSRLSSAVIQDLACGSVISGFDIPVIPGFCSFVSKDRSPQVQDSRNREKGIKKPLQTSETTPQTAVPPGDTGQQKGPILPNNASLFITRPVLQKLNQLSNKVLPHPPCSSDLSPSDCYFFKHPDSL